MRTDKFDNLIGPDIGHQDNAQTTSMINQHSAGLYPNATASFEDGTIYNLYNSSDLSGTGGQLT